jgi:hypothetical protein
MDAQWKRISAILGDAEDQDFKEAVRVFFEHLRKSLELPCEVTGSEDFRWEEPYVIGNWSQKEWHRLRRDQPSYEDVYDLLELDVDVFSEWMMFRGDDIGARVKRKSDGKEFWLGLAELKATKRKSPNARLLDDYAVFLVNSR